MGRERWETESARSLKVVSACKGYTFIFKGIFYSYRAIQLLLSQAYIISLDKLSYYLSKNLNLICIKNMFVYLPDLKRLIAMTEVEISNVKKEVDYWTQYKDQGQHQHRTQIRALEGEIKDMTHSFNEMKGIKGGLNT